jgi:hypothetical protein
MFRRADGCFPRLQVEWIRGSAFDEAALKTILPSVTSVVHTLGILLEADYKSGGLAGLASGVLQGFKDNLSGIRENSNPLAPRNAYAKKKGLYETINRDSALAVLGAYLETRSLDTSSPNSQQESPFVYISAEDVFRPVIPARYIATKREAEIGIQRLAETARSMMAEGIAGDNEFERLETPQRLARPVLMRPSSSLPSCASKMFETDRCSPGLIYDPQIRPPSAIPAALLGASASLQSRLPVPLRAYTGSSIFSALTSRYSSARPDLPSASESIANLLSTPPVHVETVAEAVCRSIETPSVRGVVGVRDMEALCRGETIGNSFAQKGSGYRPMPQL